MGRTCPALTCLFSALVACLSLASCVWQPQVVEGVTYETTHDADGDGVVDSDDIVASARSYVETRPRYGSAYYVCGRPDDGQGVCTDVVDQALLGAGYDLMRLVDADIRTSPEAYPEVEAADANIDFRRVRNLRIYFDRHALSLTLDATDTDAWAGGDIVCWADHIGIVSDRRSASGRTLIIHHAGPFQLSFEQDVLDTGAFGPIVGHWRLP